MKYKPSREYVNIARMLLVGLLLLGMAVAARIWMSDIPNFKPIGAIALFAGFYFARSSIAILVVLAAMAGTDLLLGPYQWQITLTVYGCLLAPVLIGRGMHRWNATNLIPRPVGLVARSVVAGFAISLVFFALTNWAWWQFSAMYDRSISGLILCYAAALPFFRWTLASNFVFALLLFGAYAMIVELSRRRNEQPVLSELPG